MVPPWGDCARGGGGGGGTLLELSCFLSIEMNWDASVPKHHTRDALDEHPPCLKLVFSLGPKYFLTPTCNVSSPAFMFSHECEDLAQHSKLAKMYAPKELRVL